MKVSQICTVKNEESSVGNLIGSLLSQSRPPDEIIIVDGGSTDRTREVIGHYIEQGAPIHLIVEDGANIARGRNIAIRSARYEIISSTDAGCVLDRRWLEHLVERFEEDPTIDVVSGSYRYTGNSHFKRAVAEIMSQQMPAMDDDFMPSSRSIAFKKSAWERVGGYPEDLDYAEDSTFDFDLRASGSKFKMAKDALVEWEMRENISGVYKQGFNYSKWDVIAQNPFARRRQRIAAYGLAALVVLMAVTALLPAAGLSLVVLAGLYYFIRYGVLLYLRSKAAQDLVNGPMIVAAITSGEILGALSGFFQGKVNRSIRT